MENLNIYSSMTPEQTPYADKKSMWCSWYQAQWYSFSWCLKQGWNVMNVTEHESLGSIASGYQRCSPHDQHLPQFHQRATLWRCSPQSPEHHVLSLTYTLNFLVSESIESVAAGLVTVPGCSGGSCRFPDGGSCVHTAGSNRVWPHCGSFGGYTGSPAP